MTQLVAPTIKLNSNDKCGYNYCRKFRERWGKREQRIGEEERARLIT
jgi:hypothetical protein